jgi:hypothetical protein
MHGQVVGTARVGDGLCRVRGTSLIRNRLPMGPYTYAYDPMVVLGGGGCFL